MVEMAGGFNVKTRDASRETTLRVREALKCGLCPSTLHLSAARCHENCDLRPELEIEPGLAQEDIKSTLFVVHDFLKEYCFDGVE